ncbi:MAG: radical SAM protein [Prevotella sp.]|nr:radical SAM protein [Prevotella sp.]
MSTIIYPSPIFGPVISRRLGVSLGVNLMPGDGKVCSFDCIYCECGFNSDFRPKAKRPTRQEVREALTAVLKQRHNDGEALNVITFAGNGEPTGHPDFAAIIDDVVEARDKYFPDANIAVLSNATNIDRDEVRNALMKVDDNIQKLDTISPIYIKKVDRPVSPSYDVDKVVANLKKFDGHVIIQTMFMKGTYNGETVDNTGAEYVQPWLEAVKDIKPQKVMIYTIDRETPAHGLKKAEPATLDSIKDLVEQSGIPCSASY